MSKCEINIFAFSFKYFIKNAYKIKNYACCFGVFGVTLRNVTFMKVYKDSPEEYTVDCKI